MQAPQFVLSYWNIRGTTQALRDLLEYLGVNYQDRVIEWPRDIQYNLEKMLEYPRMPNLKHGGFQVSQIVPIGKYLCRVTNRLDLLGKTLRDEVEIDTFIMQTFHARKVYLDAMGSLQNQSQAVFQKQMFEKLRGLRETFLKNLIQRLGSREWYMGYLSLADFFLYNVLFYFQGFVPELVADHTIDSYMTRFESIENLNKYFKSGKANHQPSLAQEVNKYWIGKRNYK